MANGTIAFDTLSTSGQISGTAKSVDTDYVVNGSAKQWSKYNQQTPAITDSFNTTSITDAATGKFTTVITNAMSNTTYTTVGTCISVGNYHGATSGPQTADVTITTSNYGLRTASTSNETLRDMDHNSVLVHGDLA